jgi:hypothetical protein
LTPSPDGLPSLTEGPAKVLVAEIFPVASRGTVDDLNSAAVGPMALPASVIAGVRGDQVSPATPLPFGAALAAASVLGLALVPQSEARHRH